MIKGDLININRVRGESLAGEFVKMNKDTDYNYYVCILIDDQEQDVPVSNIALLEVLGRAK